MKATWTWLGALLCSGALACPAWAGNYFPTYPYLPQAPDACNPGFYATNPCGAPYGPNYCLRPPYPPFNGIRPCPQQRPVGYPTHPFARGPRDFFMLD